MSQEGKEELPADLDEMVDRVRGRLENQWESEIRSELAQRDRTWLEDQLVQVILRDRAMDSTPQRALSRQEPHVEPVAQRQQRLKRIQKMGWDADKLKQTVQQYQKLNRESLVKDGYLIDPPHKGLAALTEANRSDKGRDLLQEAHDLFYALLFCDEKQGVRLPRPRRDFLTVTLPTKKKESLERFMLAVTETQALGTWLDPKGVSDDIDARNTILQVEYGDAPDHQISDALLVVLGMINELEVNEEILYGRIECLQRSTLT